jgi:hypothetical protein
VNTNKRRLTILLLPLLICATPRPGLSAADNPPATKKQAPATKGKAGATSTRKPSKQASSRLAYTRAQGAPTKERYRQIQDALASKGYLGAEQATGQWTDASVDALKRFQADQNIDATGKINSLSLIALGLGPKHESAPPPQAP